MTIQANKLKKEPQPPQKPEPEPKEAPAKTQPKKKQEKEKPTKTGIRNESIPVVVGFLFIAIALFMAVALSSYFYSWQQDFDKIDTLTFSEIIGGKTQISNFGGSLGAALSHLLIYQWFGIGSYAFSFTLFLLGFKLAFKTNLLPLFKSFRIAFYYLIYSSIVCGFLFSDYSSAIGITGGNFGRIVSMWMLNALGLTGFIILLIFLLIAFTSFTLNFPATYFKRKALERQQQKLLKEEALKNYQQTLKNGAEPKEDIYNTVEFAVKDKERDFGQKGTENEKDSETVLDDEDEVFLIKKNVNKPLDTEKTNTKTSGNTKANEVEFTIENQEPLGVIPKPETQKTEKEILPDATHKLESIPHQTLDMPYDPTLDLPHYKYPPVEILENYGSDTISVQKEELEANKRRIVETLNNYAIDIQKIKATIGPTVTLYEIVPAPGVRISKIKNLEDDIALSLSALGIRIIAPIPGKGTIGIEVPNQNPEIVSMRSILNSEKFINTKFELPIGLGKTIANECFIADLAKMPHLLMAGATGQGKSVGLNAIITSLLYKKHPSQLKFVLVDPKKVELTLFSKIERHYLAKLPDSEEAIITDTRVVVRTLNSLCVEMDHRYELLKDAQVRTIKEYNAKFIERKLNPNQGHHYLPYIVLVVDEFADLIMTAGKEIELPITRLAQLARAIGIHLIIATQRPSVNIITGTIKANFPARIAFRVSSKIDSRTILDTGGADQLIGRGDMLLSTGSDLLRLQCAFIDTPEIDHLTEFVGSQRGYPEAFNLPEYTEEGTAEKEEFDPNERDDLFEDAARVIVANQQGSTSLIQRKLKLGYNRAGRIIDQLEAAGIVGPFEGSKAREVRVPNEQALEQYFNQLNQSRK